MITIKNLKEVLGNLEFTSKGEVYTKKFESFDCLLKVDFKKKEIVYPENKGLKINERQTCNLKANENFVVLECVNRLLEQGYNPAHIELEPKWKVGHGASGGRADVLVRDHKGKSLLIIECKNAGIEFTKHWNETLENGSQLFGYAQQEKDASFLCLYASDFIDEKVKPNYRLITLKDNKQYLEDNPKFESFKDAKVREDLYRVWKTTYQKDFTTKGLFEKDIQAYNIGKKKYSIDDLSLVDSSTKQSKHHSFATILRKYNVSGRENAFDKLVNLFLCKIVDEKNNPKDLQFYWKGIAYDTPFELQDRLQKLYQTGMNEFLKEDVTYIDNKQIDKAFWAFKNDPDATRETIKGYFKQLKFFTNNDFAFIDVHNERLFYENAEVLIDIVRLFQDTKIKSNTKNQFLGDMFENFLDGGVKQSEGQFFTPMPITRFIIQSLPLESIISGSQQIPKAIDYACGSGHFLNELASQMRPFIEANKDVSLEEYHKAIHGIEKEYRLSKVAKVSAFMYGQDNIDITYADALSKNDKFNSNDYQILVANPPYSVKGFLGTLDQDSKDSFDLSKTLDSKQISTNNSIECFFIEKAKQMLGSNGVAAIILPASILSNGDSTYVETRSIILKYFDIIAISEFGSGTFSKTGTNTVTLFLRRKESKPEQAEHYQNRVNAWFSNDTKKQKIFEDEHFIQSYCQHIEIDFDDYKTFLTNKYSEALLKTEMFAEYKDAFNKLTTVKNKKKQSSFTKLSKQEQQSQLDILFINHITKIEKEKLYYFILASENKSKVLVTKVKQSDKKDKKQRTKEQNFLDKQYLGYEWSAAKENAGIQIFTDDNNNHITPLYDPINRDNNEKINYYIQRNFEGIEESIPTSLKDNLVYTDLIDLINFRRNDFDRQISITAKKESLIKSKWPLQKLGLKCDVKIGGTPSRAVNKYFTGNNLWVSISEMNGQNIINTNEKITNEAITKSNVKLIPKGTTLLSFKLSIGKTAIAGKDLYTNEAIAGLIPKDKDLIDSYLFHLFTSKLIDLENVGNKAFGKSLNSTYLKEEVKIPVPNLVTQQKIIDECKIVDNEKDKSERQIQKAKDDIENIIVNTSKNSSNSKKISELAIINPSKTEIKNIDNNTIISFIEMASVNNKGFVESTVDKKLEELRKGSYKYFKENDIIIAKITPCMENGKCAIATNLTNGLGMGSSEFHVFRFDEKLVLKEYAFAILNRQVIRREAESNMTGSSGHRRVPSSFYESYKIPVPTIKEQKEIIKKIKSQEKIIEKANEVIETIAERKQAVLKKHL